jgi:hypothetical protein
MDHILEFVDARQKTWCIHCGATLARVNVSRDHVPSKGLLLKPYPANLPVVEVCAECNVSFSLDEEYTVAFLGAVIAGSTDPANQDNPAAEIFARNPKLKARIERGKTEYETIGGETRVTWKAESERIARVILKNARGHAFFEYGEPMLDVPTHAASISLTALSAGERARFEDVDMGPVWPEVGSRMMTRMRTGQDLSGGWVVVQDGVYRYSVSQEGSMIVKAVLFEYLAAEVCWAD